MVKYGGSAMLDPNLQLNVIRDVALLKLVGMKPIIVHGGGKEISKWVEMIGKEPEFINGLRVTDAETMEIAEMVLNKVNKGLVQRIEKLGVNLIGTQLDKKTGKIAGRCCYGKEKVKYLVISNYFPQHKIDEFYSDSITDTPLAYCAEKAFLVTNKGRKVVPWPKISSRVKNKILNTLL